VVRLIAIDTAVRENTFPNARTLGKQLDVTPRTIQRDIECARDQLGWPLEFDRKENGYFYSDRSFTPSLFKVTEGELVALLVASQVMKHYRGTPFEPNLRRALRRIEMLLPDQVDLSLDDLSSCLTVLPRVQTAYNPQVFSALLAAVRRSRQVRMVYWTASRNDTSEREVDPYDLVVAPDDDWCLLGHCHLRHHIRMFKVQRVQSVEETGETFDRPRDFRARDYMADTFGTIRGEGTYDVALLFSRAYAGIIAEKEWHPGQVLEHQPDGTLVLRMHVNDLRLVKRWVLSWGPECEALEPAELIEMIAMDLEAVSRKYRRNAHPTRSKPG
jgi:predicted DNA-binding transcriptional regulator YafY